ncbi:uncharacterized protein [Littorina saxatilis]|uniref:uncharacterized protein n=1 Tax=Littorina saxatilis TaxID=31220 RepID=UPI0038B59C02
MDEGVFANLDNFLLAIHARFLEIVDPIESGLIDILRQDNVLGCDEEEEIRAEATRRNKARTCWNLLLAVQPSVFERHCFPALEKLYPHVLQKAVYSLDKLCLRHVIKKTCLHRFADVFVMTGACSHDEYCIVTEDCPDKTKWDLVFHLCAKNGKNLKFVSQVKSKLMSIQVEIPDNFHALLSTGFPCVCKTAANARQSKKKLEHDSNSEACESSSVYSLPTADDTIDKGNGSASISSGASGKTVKAEVSDHEIEETQFETEEQKETFLLELEQTNKAVTKACSIRSLSRELAGIKEELSTLREKAKSESETSTNRAFLNDGKIFRLHDRARDVYQTLKQNYEEVSDLKRNIATEELTFDFEIPFTRKRVLLERRHMLVGEVTEAAPFLQQAEILFPTMSIPENQAPAPFIPVPKMFSPRLQWNFDDDHSWYVFEDEHDAEADCMKNVDLEDHTSDLLCGENYDDDSREAFQDEHDAEADCIKNVDWEDHTSDLLCGENDDSREAFQDEHDAEADCIKNVDLEDHTSHLG